MALAIPLLHFLFGLITTALFCTAAVIASSRAPRQLPWLSLAAASLCCATISGLVNLIFLSQMQGGRSVSELNGLLIVQGILSGLGSLLLLGGAVVLVLFLMNERRAVAPAAEPWQKR
jgi:uncharacterized membrane protein